MIASVIGRTFLESYNKEYNKTYSPKDFFNQEFFELFYNHNKYSQWITNSPFVQMKKNEKVETLTFEGRQAKLNDFHLKAQKAISNNKLDASIAIGFPASEMDEFATTSGQVTDLLIPASDDEIYYSWIGNGLAVGIAGGVSLFFNEPKILLQIYEGWKHYREFLNNEPTGKLRGNQINTWNGQWLTYVNSKVFKFDFDLSDLVQFGAFSQAPNLMEATTIKWSQLFFSLSRLLPNQVTNAYVFSYGQMNKTYGFIPFYFSSAITLIEYYKKLFGENNAITDAPTYEQLFGLNIRYACQLGSIGLQALQPSGLSEYFDNENMPSFKKKTKQEDDDKQIITFKTYKTWLIAMLNKNKNEMLDYTSGIAKALRQYVSTARKTDKSNLVEKELLAAKSKKQFLTALTTILEQIDANYVHDLKELRDRVHLMTSEDFAYFNVLLRFDYAYLERQS